MMRFCAKRLFPSGRLGFQMFVRPSVRKKGDFCEGYKRLGTGQIRLGKNRKSCPGKTWFLRRVQASRTGSDPPRQFFRSQIRVLKKNLHKLRFANRNPSGLDPFLDLLFGAKNQLFFTFFCEKNTKKYPNILMQEMIKMIRNWSFAPPALQGVI